MWNWKCPAKLRLRNSTLSSFTAPISTLPIQRTGREIGRSKHLKFDANWGFRLSEGQFQFRFAPGDNFWQLFFCYNDYRTHVGDRGMGALQQRVHGVVDVY